MTHMKIQKFHVNLGDVVFYMNQVNNDLLYTYEAIMWA